MAALAPAMPHSPTTVPQSPASTDIVSPQSNRFSTDASGALIPPPSPYPQFIEPSPVDSHGTASTDATDIDDVAQDKEGEEAEHIISAGASAPASAQRTSPQSATFDSLARIETNLDSKARDDPESGSQSVIHVPDSFQSFESLQDHCKSRSTTSPTEHSEQTVVSPQSSNGALTPMINTDLPSRPTLERDTPRAQTRQEAEDEWKRRNKKGRSMDSVNLRQSSGTPGLWSTWLADIPETPQSQSGQRNQDLDPEPEDEAEKSYPQGASSDEDQSAQVAALKTALTECWTLCNTLGKMSSNHRKQVFNSRISSADLQETAWQSCWRLCQNLYNSREDSHVDHVLPTLEMCREFCQALFDVRRKEDELADSILRVSFELNNHLYNTHDRNLPIAFQERTLDFYLTLCHRLMKQRTSLPQETDALLRACWALAEMLFSMRQKNREGKPADEELLSSAVQACWELCDLFREGWTQVRPDRGTPKPSQTTFTSSFRSGSASNRSSPSMTRSTTSFQDVPVGNFPPETPTTIFDDTNDESMDDDIDVPNILVLGPDKASSTAQKRWSSSASNLSAFSDARSNQTSNTATSSSAAAQTSLNRIRLLLVKAANIAGFTLRGYSPPNSRSASPSVAKQNASLVSFVKAMPRDAFGSQPWQMALVPKVKKLVNSWPGLVRHVGPGGDLGDGSLIQANTASRRVTGSEIARAVGWMMRSEEHVWLRELFRVAFGVWPDDNASLAGVTVQG